MRPARIVVFAKAPVSGKVKTRLIPALGAEGAAALAREMLERTLAEALASGLVVELCGEPHPAQWGSPFDPTVTLTGQGEGELGSRLARAAERAVAAGERVLLVGTDCPGLDCVRLRAAAAALDGHEAVIHPTEDGGYALLGLARFDPSLFEGIGWSGPDVTRDTIARIRALGWTLRVGETLHDVDEPADLRLLGPEWIPADARL